MNYSIRPIAYIHNNFKEKFGIPRQSGLASNTLSTIVFEKDFRDDNSLRGLETFSHIWLLWIFNDKNNNKDWSPTVRPPRLGGNTRVGVFATRSPYHPNGIGLSCVKIEGIEKTECSGTVIRVSGADLLDGTPIIDIKPYLAFTDSHNDAICGFADVVSEYELSVEFGIDINSYNSCFIKQINEILKQDPRPSYQNDPERIYSMKYAEYDIKFKVNNNILTVIDIENQNGSDQ